MGIVFDENRELTSAQRLALTLKLGYAESVFINDSASPDVSIFNPQQEIQFAGVPMLGAAWLLARLKGKPVNMIHCRLGGNIRTLQEGELTQKTGSS